MQPNSTRESSSEFITLQTFDGRVVTRISIGTQTDWTYKDECSQESKLLNYSLQKSLTTEIMTGDPHLDDSSEKLADNESLHKNTEFELKISPDNEMLDLHSKETPRAPTACQEGTEETLTNLDKISASSGSEQLLHAALNICSENSQQLKKPPATSVPITNSVDPKESFCSTKTKKTFTMAFSKTETDAVDETVTDGESATKEDQRENDLKSKEASQCGPPEAGHKQAYGTSANLPLDEALVSMEEALLPEIEINCSSVFSFNVKRERSEEMMPLIKLYNSGKTFMLVFPDGTGQVCYPSGRLAILVAAMQTADWSYVVILEDKRDEPRVQAIFTGTQQTCYHENSSIWVNLTSRGGAFFNEHGDVKKCWRWQENKHHIHAPPCHPLSFTLNHYLNIHIKSQDNISVVFSSHKHSIQLNNEAKLKAKQGRKLIVPGANSLQTYLKEKSTEIKALLQNIQSLVTYQRSASPTKVKLPQSLILQMERRWLPVKPQHAAKKTPKSGRCPSIGFSHLYEATGAGASLEFEFTD